MLFNSWEFVILLLVTFSLYYLPLSIRRIWQVCLLLVASAVFYGWGEPKLLILLAISCAGNTLAAERILHWKFTRENETKAHHWLVVSITANLGLLAFFKYAGFIAQQLPPGWISAENVQGLMKIPLPVGISFYTFQGISLLVDVWRRDLEDAQMVKIAGKGGHRLRAFTDLSFYIAFFPQLVAGPIVKAREFVSQIGGKALKDVHWSGVVKSLILGYFLKIVVADNLSEQTVILTKPWMSQMGPLDLVLLLYSYSLQIFADFAGYSLIAIGLGALFGYSLPINFNFPYLSTSITEFWRRWHLSLSSWLRDYLYIPLGGNRKGSGRTYFNLLAVMFLGGLWHGAAWKFALWGTLHGLLLMGERLVAIHFKRDSSVPKGRLRSIFGWFYTFHAVTLLWLTFLMPDLQQIGLFFRELTIMQRWHGPMVFVPLFFGSFVVLYHGAAWIKEHYPTLANRFRGSVLEGVAYGLMLFLVITNPGPPQGFIYFQF